MKSISHQIRLTQFKSASWISGHSVDLPWDAAWDGMGNEIWSHVIVQVMNQIKESIE